MAAYNANNITAQQPTIFREGGSGFTVFQWMGSPIAFAQTIGFTSPSPVAAPVSIQPLDQQYPQQIMVPAAIGAGTLTVQLFEIFNYKVWDQIMAVTDQKFPNGQPGAIYNDLSEVFLRLAAIGNGITASKMIFPPYSGVFQGSGISPTSPFSPTPPAGNNPGQNGYADTYFGCVITDIRDDENISIGTMEVIKNITIMYRYSRRVQFTSTSPPSFYNTNG